MRVGDTFDNWEITEYLGLTEANVPNFKIECLECGNITSARLDGPKSIPCYGCEPVPEKPKPPADRAEARETLTVTPPKKPGSVGDVPQSPRARMNFNRK